MRTNEGFHFVCMLQLRHNLKVFLVFKFKEHFNPFTRLKLESTWFPFCYEKLGCNGVNICHTWEWHHLDPVFVSQMQLVYANQFVFWPFQEQWMYGYEGDIRKVFNTNVHRNIIDSFGDVLANTLWVITMTMTYLVIQSTYWNNRWIFISRFHPFRCHFHHNQLNIISHICPLHKIISHFIIHLVCSLVSSLLWTFSKEIRDVDSMVKLSWHEYIWTTNPWLSIITFRPWLSHLHHQIVWKICSMSGRYWWWWHKTIVFLLACAWVTLMGCALAIA